MSADVRLPAADGIESLSGVTFAKVPLCKVSCCDLLDVGTLAG